MARVRGVPIVGFATLLAACAATSPAPLPSGGEAGPSAAADITERPVDCLDVLRHASSNAGSGGPASALTVLQLGSAEGAAFILGDASRPPAGEAAARQADCVLVLAPPPDFTLATRSLGQETMTGEYRVRTVRRLNPDYLEARREVAALEGEGGGSASRIAASGDLTFDLIGLAIAGISKGAEFLIGQQRLADAEETLEDTPKFIEESEFAPYRLHLREVELVKSALVQVALVDPGSEVARKAVLPVEDRAVLTVAANLHTEDRRRQEGGAAYLSPAEFEARSKAPATIATAALLAGAYRALAAAEPVAGDLAGTSAALAEAARHAGPPAATGIRGGEVVAVESGPSVVRVGGLAERGVGVYVRPDLVLTSRSLLGGSGIVEVEGPEGESTYGILEAADERSDLALVYVQRAGQPMRLADQPPPVAAAGFAWDTPWGTPLGADGRLVGLVLAPAAGGVADLATIKGFLAAQPIPGRSAGSSRAAASPE